MLAVVRALRDEQLREPERLAGFVYGTARNVINNYLRARSRLPREDSIDAALHLASPPDAVDDSERIALVRRALASLESTDRKILLTDAGGRSEAWRNWRPAGADLRNGAGPEVARPEKNHRPREKTVTKMSANATNSPKDGMDCDQGGTRGDSRELPGGQVERRGPRRVRSALFRCARCFDELQTLQAIQRGAASGPADVQAQPDTSVGRGVPRRRAGRRCCPGRRGDAVDALAYAVGFARNARPPSGRHRWRNLGAAAASRHRTPAVASAPSLEQLARFEPPRYEPLRLRGVPDEATARFQRGMEHYRKADYAAAVDDLRAAVELDPDAAHTRFFLGISYLILGQDNAGDRSAPGHDCARRLGVSRRSALLPGKGAFCSRKDLGCCRNAVEEADCASRVQDG